MFVLEASAKTPHEDSASVVARSWRLQRDRYSSPSLRDVEDFQRARPEELSHCMGVYRSMFEQVLQNRKELLQQNLQDMNIPQRVEPIPLFFPNTRRDPNLRTHSRGMGNSF
jgi:hypothetical protein